jgi:hypothetical protein
MSVPCGSEKVRDAGVAGCNVPFLARSRDSNNLPKPTIHPYSSPHVPRDMKLVLRHVDQL